METRTYGCFGELARSSAPDRLLEITNGSLVAAKYENFLAERRAALEKLEGRVWVGSTNSPDEKAAAQDDFLLSGRYPAHCRRSGARTPTAVQAELCELAFRQVSEYSRRSGGCFPEPLSIAVGRTETMPLLHHTRRKAVTSIRVASIWLIDPGASGQRGRNPHRFGFPGGHQRSEGKKVQQQQCQVEAVISHILMHPASSFYLHTISSLQLQNLSEPIYSHQIPTYLQIA